MDAIDKAIRNALRKGDTGSRAFREKVYQSAFAALERTMGRKPKLDAAAADQRRKALKSRIITIEAEFASARSAGDENPSSTGSRPDASVAPSPRIDPENHVRNEPDKDTPPLDRHRRWRPFATAFTTAILFAFAGIGGWWAIESGLLNSAGQRNGAVPNPARVLEAEDFDGEATQSSPAGSWISIFTPTDPTSVSAPGSASAEVRRDDDEAFLRISSTADSGVIFDVGQGVLGNLAGKRATFSIDARAAGGTETEISISCQFGALGNCGRTRYEIGTERSEYLFEVRFPNTNPDTIGAIAVVPDLTGRGRSLDIFSIRVLAGP